MQFTPSTPSKCFALLLVFVISAGLAAAPSHPEEVPARSKLLLSQGVAVQADAPWNFAVARAGAWRLGASESNFQYIGALILYSSGGTAKYRLRNIQYSGNALSADLVKLVQVQCIRAPCPPLEEKAGSVSLSFVSLGVVGAWHGWLESSGTKYYSIFPTSHSPFASPTPTPTVYPTLTPSPEPCYCIALYDPVCGSDGKTYGNSCQAKCAGVEVAYRGECRATTPKPQLPDCQPTVLPLCAPGYKIEKVVDGERWCYGWTCVPENDERFYACWQNGDCVVAESSCCSCRNGGVQAAINKNYVDEWNARLDCQNKDLYCQQSYNCVEGATAVCRSNRCQIASGAYCGNGVCDVGETMREELARVTVSEFCPKDCGAYYDKEMCPSLIEQYWIGVSKLREGCEAQTDCVLHTSFCFKIGVASVFNNKNDAEWIKEIEEKIRKYCASEIRECPASQGGIIECGYSTNLPRQCRLVFAV